MPNIQTEGNVLCSLSVAQKQAVVPSSHTACLLSYTFTPLWPPACYLLSHSQRFPFIFLREYSLHLICQHYTIHSAGAVPGEILLQGRGAGLVGVSSVVTSALRTTAVALCRQPDLCPCWEIPQHSWKHCRCDWELCFGTPAAATNPHGSVAAWLPKFHRFTEILKERWKTSWRSRSGSRGWGEHCDQQAPTVLRMPAKSWSSLVSIITLGTQDN